MPVLPLPWQPARTRILTTRWQARPWDATSAPLEPTGVVGVLAFVPVSRLSTARAVQCRISELSKSIVSSHLSFVLLLHLHQ
jgi:hypothetical protein